MLAGYLLTNVLEFLGVWTPEEVLERYWSDWQPWEFDIDAEEPNHWIHVEDFYPDEETLKAGLDQAITELREWVAANPEDESFVSEYLEAYEASLAEAGMDGKTGTGTAREIA